MKELLRKMFNSKNKKRSIGIICGVVALIVVIVLVLIFNPFGGKNKKIEKQLTARLEELGKNFYENYYYNQLGKDDDAKKEFVKGYAHGGIKIDLANIARTNTTEADKIIAEFKNANGDACDTSESKVIIYPKEPYGSKDYTIKVHLECNFGKKKKDTTTKANNTSEQTTTVTTTTTTKTTKKKK